MNQIAYSFDIFDTTLVRIWARPTDLFWDLGYYLHQEQLISISLEQWMELRIEAEAQERRTSATGEITLQQIYDNLATSFSWSIDARKRAMQKELELELLSLRPVPEVSKKIQLLHEENAKVIYISDIYMSQETIQSFLKQNGLWSDSDALYVSSELKVNKATGQLFERCLETEAIAATQLNHLGDNLHSDVKVPNRFGIHVRHFTQAHLNRYENLISNEHQLPLKFRSLLAGASRLTRLKLQEDCPKKQVIWETSASVVAPVLFGFVYWCLEEAKTRDIQRLYFVARDGQILLKIAKIICQEWGYSIDCRYLYGSRQAWHFPAISVLGEAELNWIFDPTNFLSVISVCERVNLKPNQIKSVLTLNGFPENKWNINLDNQQRDLLKKVFSTPEVSALIIAISTEYRRKAIGYFEQEGLGDSTKFGIVDIGWNGRLQRSLSILLEKANMYPKNGTYGFYFSLAKRLKAFPMDSLLAYFSDVDSPSQHDYLCNDRNLFEIFVAADHGGTVRFEETEGRYIPILRSDLNEKAINWGLAVQQKAITEFAEQLTSILKPQDCEISLFLMSSELLLKEFIQNPSSREAEVFGSIEISEDQTDNIYYELSPRYTLADSINWLVSGKNVHQNVWLPGSIARSRLLPKLLLKVSRSTKSRLKMWLRKLKSSKRGNLNQKPRTLL